MLHTFIISRCSQLFFNYKYVRIEDTESFVEEHRKLCQSHGLNGRIIFAREGINYRTASWRGS